MYISYAITKLAEGALLDSPRLAQAWECVVLVGPRKFDAFINMEYGATN